MPESSLHRRGGERQERDTHSTGTNCRGSLSPPTTLRALEVILQHVCWQHSFCTMSPIIPASSSSAPTGILQ